MVRRTFTSREVVNEFITLVNQGATAIRASRKAEIGKQNPLPMVRGCGGLRMDQTRQPEELEKEKTRLKKLGACGTELPERDC